MNNNIFCVVLIYLSVSIFFLLENSLGVATIKTLPNEEVHWSEKRNNVSRALGFKNKTKKSSITTIRPTWRPKQNGKLLLAKQKKLNIKNISEIPIDDPEFIYSWSDDYYDTYTFEHNKNMIRHGTFESRYQNYYKAELEEAMKKLNTINDYVESNDTEVEEIESTLRPLDVKSNITFLKLNLTTTPPLKKLIKLTKKPKNRKKNGTSIVTKKNETSVVN